MEVGPIVGGRVVSTVISKLINGIIDYAKDQKKMQLGLKDELKRLEIALPKIQAVVNAVDQGLIKEKNLPLEKWLWQLRDAADQAEDMMDEMEYNFVKGKIGVNKDKASKVVSNFKTFLKRAVYKDAFLERLKKVVMEIDEVAAGVGEFYVLVQYLDKKQNQMVKSIMNSRETSSVLNLGTRVYGREKEKEDIIKKLLNPEIKIEELNYVVLPIVGLGGVGKTTLAQLVYNDPEVEKYFELRMWVCISNNFDVVLLTKKLYESVFERKADFENFDLIQRKLKEELNSKRFLVVFDDAWNDADGQGWNKLFAPLRSGKSGSMILLTTQMETVAKLTGPNIMDSVFLEGLNEQDMLDLFKECAFRDEDPNSHKELVEIGRGIVNKLKGSPLAATTVGGALCSDLSETHWRRILESELWSLEKGPNDIMPALRLSYQHLPSHLKPCFSFCSIFPQDHVFIKDDLIYMWVALGLVPRDFSGEIKPEDVGSKYFEDMLNRSIFSHASPVSNTRLQYPAYTYHNVTEKLFVGGYIMHDLMHDLSSLVSQGEFFRSDTNKSVPIPTTVRHLYIHVGDCCDLSNLNLNNIRTLILQFDDSNHPELVCILNKMLKGMTSLRLLTIFALKLSEIPGSVGDLLHLRYLSLSSFMLGGYPQSMSRLYFLETIVCGGFGLNRQADVLLNLIKLRHIIASESFVETITGIGRLTSLQELNFRVRKESGFKISELKNMRELWRLSISNINDVGNHDEAKQANLSNKVGLRELSLQWETSAFDEKVFDHLEPNCNLKELRIRNYMGGRLPIWESRRLSSLVKLEISYCINLISLDEGFLRNSEKLTALEDLIISNCKRLKMAEEGFSKFVSLKTLDISKCPKIKLFNVLVLFPPSKLQFVRINDFVHDGIEKNEYMRDIIADLTNEIDLYESSLQQDPTVRTEDAMLVVLDHPGENFKWKVRLSRMEDYMGRWPPIWLPLTPSMLEYLCIIGSPDADEYCKFNVLPDGMNRLLRLIIMSETNIEQYPSLEVAYPSDKPALEQFYLATLHIKWLQCLRKLTIILCSNSSVMPSLPVTLKELRLIHLGLKVLPNFYGDNSRASGSLQSLISMTIEYCPRIISLAEGLFQKPQQFSGLEQLKILNCYNLTELPQGGFNKFISLKELDIRHCFMIKGQFVEKCFLPSALQGLHIRSCGDLDTIISKALESVHSLNSLSLVCCENISSLPPRKVFSRWKTLEKLEFVNCKKLTSLESLFGLFSVKSLTISGCCKLVSAITSPSAWQRDVEDGTRIQTSNRPASTQPTPTDPCRPTNTEHKPLLSVDEMEIDDPQLLYIEPIRSISSVRKLTIVDCSNLKSLPELPPVLEEVSLLCCCPELQRRCDKSGADWPKLSHVPKVYISEKDRWGW